MRPPKNPTLKRRPITYLWAKHKEIIRRHFLNHSHPQIAKAVGVSVTTVSNTINNPLAQEILKRMHDRCEASITDVRQRIAETTPEALGVIIDTMEDEHEDPKLRTKLAQDILDRAGLGAAKKVEGTVAHALFTPEDIIDMKKRVTSARNPTDVEGIAEEIEAEVIA